MILRGGGGRAGLEREESFQGLLKFRANDTSIVSLLGLEGMDTSGKLEHCWLVSKNFWKRKPEGSDTSCSESL